MRSKYFNGTNDLLRYFEAERPPRSEVKVIKSRVAQTQNGSWRAKVTKRFSDTVCRSVCQRSRPLSHAILRYKWLVTPEWKTALHSSVQWYLGTCN